MIVHDPRPLIAHIVFRFDIGGLENGVVNVINGLPEGEFRHAVIALTEAGAFQERIRRGDVSVHALGKRPGKDPAAYLRLFRLLRRLRPVVAHTRNLGTLECAAVAALAGVPCRIHGEHGWDVHDPDGNDRKYRMLRRVINVFVDKFVTVSRDLHDWLVSWVGIRPGKVLHICNGVDTERFRPRPAGPDLATTSVVIGSITRFEPIKDPLNLVRAFIEARRRLTVGHIDLRLLMLGDGPLRQDAIELLRASGEADTASLPGSQNNVSHWLQSMHVYALGSKREGISNTVLEAMACGLPVIASATGGNLELVEPGVTGMLVPPEDPAALTDAIIKYATNATLRVEHGRAARRRAEQNYSLADMVAAYRDLYCVATAPIRVAA